MTDAIKRAKRLRDIAWSLKSKIDDTSIASGTREYADDVISTYSALTPSGAVVGRRDYLQSFSAAVSSFVSACDRALEDMARSSGMDWWLEGWCWDVWINTLTKIAQEHHLPTGVRKDTDKNKTGKPSPFVAFVRQLQAYIPSEHRRATHSTGAQAEAISTARTKPKSRHRPRWSSVATRTKIVG